MTVLIPVRNGGQTIEQALVSVLRRLPDDAKVLALDDASSDSTGDILSAMARRDGRLGVLTSRTQMGVAAALNELVDEADSPLVARMDADDVSLPLRFWRQLRKVERGGADAVFTSLVMFGPSRFAVRPQPPLPASPAATPYELILTNTLAHPTFLGRREAILAAGGYRDVPAEDWDLWMRMVLRGCRLARLGIPGLLYRRHSGQVTANKQWKAARALDSRTAESHFELATSLLGSCERGAYAALSGGSTSPDDVSSAMELVDGVWEAAASFGIGDRTGVRANAFAIRRYLSSLLSPTIQGGR